MRQQWRRILYACTPIMLNIEPRDVTVTSPHRALTCLAGCGHSKQAIPCAADQFNRADRPERTPRDRRDVESAARPEGVAVHADAQAVPAHVRVA